MRHKNKDCFQAHKVENSIVVDEKSSRLEVNVPTRYSPCATHKDSIFCLFNKMIAVASYFVLYAIQHTFCIVSIYYDQNFIQRKNVYAVCTFIEL